jgi:NAD(P)H-hydrate repair Nnr-like enzyme with NAD(P)H-hydrate epimerase domain
VVPSRLAVHKKRPWWAQAARVVVGTAAMAVAGAAGAAAAKHTQVRVVVVVVGSGGEGCQGHREGG